MNKIEKLEDVWDNGAIGSYFLSGDDIDKFIQQTNAKKVVARRWVYQGKEYETPYYVRILPDELGFVCWEKNDLRTGSLWVLNADGTHRVTIRPPRIDANSKPENGYLNMPPSSARFGGIEWGVEGSDGYTDYLFDFDWNTGALLRYARPGRPW